MNQIQDAYTEWAAGYDDFAKKNIGIIKNYPVILGLIEKEPKKDRGLELGCGTGLLTVELSKYCQEIIGLDFSEPMLHEAQKNQA